MATTDLSSGSTKVKFRLAGGVQPLILLPVEVNGEGPFEFILDTGAPTQELGKMTMERWRTLVNQLYDLKLIKNKPAAEKLFQNF